MIEVSDNMRTGSIYIIRNTVNDKVYIGQTTMTVHERFMAHMKPSTCKKRASYKLYNAINKYGKDKFYAETLEDNVPVGELDQREIEFIDEYDSCKHGYNTTPGGDGRIFNKISDEKKILELAKSGVKASEIAEIYGVHKETVRRTLRHLGFWYRPDQKKIVNMSKSGMSNKEIANKIGCDPYTVCRALNRADCRKHRIPIKCRNDFDLESLKSDYYNQMPIQDICDKYNITKTSFYRIKKENELATRPQIYKHKVRYFDE